MHEKGLVFTNQMPWSTVIFLAKIFSGLILEHCDYFESYLNGSAI